MLQTLLAAEATPVAAVAATDPLERSRWWRRGSVAVAVAAPLTMWVGLSGPGFAVLLLAVATGLRRGLRTAHSLAVISLLLLAATSHSGSDVGGFGDRGWYAFVGVDLALVAVLVGHARHFDVPVAALSLRRAGRVAAGCAVAIGVALILVGAGDTATTGVWNHVGYLGHRALAVLGLWSGHSAVDVPLTIRFPVDVVVFALLAMSVGLALRAPRQPNALTSEDEDRLRGLLHRQGGRDSLGYFALRRDKGVVFSATGKAAITYRVLNGVSLASGDPIGDPEAWPGAIAAWSAQARDHGWRPAVLGAGEQGARIYQREAGLRVLQLGDEAVVDTTEFDLRGRAMRTLRHAHVRIARAGYRVSIVRQGEMDAATLRETAQSAQRWRDGARERGFSMALGRIGDTQDPDMLFVRCEDADGRHRALLGFVPWGRDGLSLDVMRRDRDADNGLIEFMIVELVLRAPELRIARLSLNFAVFREAFANGERLGAGPIARAHQAALHTASRWWQLESLYRANRKYQPTWTPRYVCFGSMLDLLPVSIAAGRAEGFLP